MVTTDTTHSLSLHLAGTIARLRNRLREASRTNADELSLTQLSILRRLDREGRQTAAQLSVSEHISQQAIAQNLAVLKPAGYVQMETDARDRRKLLISLTSDGKILRESIIASRDAWLVRAIEATFSSDEKAKLEDLLPLLERLADASV
jgi:DNA-binding MarR family transcriptional regulator